MSQFLIFNFHIYTYYHSIFVNYYKFFHPIDNHIYKFYEMNTNLCDIISKDFTLTFLILADKFYSKDYC